MDKFDVLLDEVEDLIREKIKEEADGSLPDNVVKDVDALAKLSAMMVQKHMEYGFSRAEAVDFSLAILGRE